MRAKMTTTAITSRTPMMPPTMAVVLEWCSLCETAPFAETFETDGFTSEIVVTVASVESAGPWNILGARESLWRVVAVVAGGVGEIMGRGRVEDSASELEAVEGVDVMIVEFEGSGSLVSLDDGDRLEVGGGEMPSEVWGVSTMK